MEPGDKDKNESWGSEVGALESEEGFKGREKKVAREVNDLIKDMAGEDITSNNK